MQISRTRPPRTLLAQAEAQANEDHNRRLAELRELQPLLQRMDELRPALSALGLTLHPSDLQLSSYFVNGDYTKRRKVLRLHSRSFLGDQQPQRWVSALAELGFREIKRSGSVYPTAVMQRGHLLLEIDVPRCPEAATASSKVQQQLAAESAFAGAAP